MSRLASSPSRRWLAVASILGLLLPACSIEPSNPAGHWVSSGEPSRVASLHLGADTRFELEGFPSEIVCGDRRAVTPDTPVGGAGRWEHDPDYGRVFLTFDRYANGTCEAPYGVMIFVLAPGRLVASRSVDDHAGAIVLSKR